MQILYLEIVLFGNQYRRIKLWGAIGIKILYIFKRLWMVKMGPGFWKMKKLNPGPAPTNQDPPIISALSGARVLQNQNPGPAYAREKRSWFPAHSGARVSKILTRKPWPRSNHPKPLHYPCSKRGRGFPETLAPLQPAKTPPSSML